jgi:hypothetical protein
MKKTIDILVRSALLLVFGFVLLSVSAKVYVFWSAKPFRLRHLQADKVIIKAGGCNVLTEEVGIFITHAKANNETWVSEDKLAKNFPVMYAVQKKLPTWPSSWEIRPPTTEIPERVVIRFGNHFSYAWLFVLAPGETLAELPDGVVRIRETVYLSPQNMYFP